MGIFGSIFGGSSSTTSKADRKKQIRERYDVQIASQQRVVEDYKKKVADARWQLKMTKDKSWKLTIENNTYYLKQQQEKLKLLKAQKTAALKNA